MSVGEQREKTAIIVAEYYVGASTTVAASVFIVSETGEITTVFVKPFVARLSGVCDGALRKLRENGFCVGLSDDAFLRLKSLVPLRHWLERKPSTAVFDVEI